MIQQESVLSCGVRNNSLRALFIIIFAFLFLGSAAPGCPFFKTNEAPRDGGVFKSDDGGLTWQQKINLTPPPGSKPGTKMDISRLNILSLAVDRNDDKIVYAGSEGSGLFRSPDQGENWEMFNNEGMPGNATIHDIAIDPKDSKKMYVADVSPEGKGRVLKSEDGGQKWEQTYINLVARDLVTDIQVDPYDSSVVYIITSADGILQSVNYGRSWTLLRRFRKGVSNLVINPRDTRVIYVTAHEEGIFKSIDKGASWGNLIENLRSFEVNPGTEFKSMQIDPQNPNTLYLGYIDGMFRTDDGGNTWQKVNILTPPQVLPINSISINENNSKNIYYTINSEVYLTNSNAASNWVVRHLPTARILQGLTINQKNPNIIYVGSKIRR